MTCDITKITFSVDEAALTQYCFYTLKEVVYIPVKNLHPDLRVLGFKDFHWVHTDYNFSYQLNV